MAGGLAAADNTTVTRSARELKCRMAHVSMPPDYDRKLANQVFETLACVGLPLSLDDARRTLQVRCDKDS
jgi:hypothetical protein